MRLLLDGKENPYYIFQALSHKRRKRKMLRDHTDFRGSCHDTVWVEGFMFIEDKAAFCGSHPFLGKGKHVKPSRIWKYKCLRLTLSVFPVVIRQWRFCWVMKSPSWWSLLRITSMLHWFSCLWWVLLIAHPSYHQNKSYGKHGIVYGGGHCLWLCSYPKPRPWSTFRCKTLTVILWGSLPGRR